MPSVIDDRRSEVVLLIVSLEMTPPEAELRFFDPTAFLVVDLCRVTISPLSEHCNCSGKSLEKPVRSTGDASQAENLFGPELLLTVDTRRHS